MSSAVIAEDNLTVAEVDGGQQAASLDESDSSSNSVIRSSRVSNSIFATIWSTVLRDGSMDVDMG